MGADSDTQHREIIAAKESYKNLLESLYFPDIHARQEGIEEAHKQTFEWIFDKSGNEDRPWHSFIDWLEDGHGTYWVSGKAGSGKSTLMNFICQDPRTETALRIWSRTDEIFMPTFFFWSPGTQLQKSLAGLLRSIVYQIMENFPNMMSVLAKSIGPSQHGLHQLPTWTEQRLRTMLEDLLSDVSKACHLCVFIDGLDEFEGDQAVVLDLIRNLEQFTSIKFCLSSRPYPVFRDELGSSAMLRLQDLTELDIRRYVSDELDKASLKASQVPYWSFNPNQMSNLIVEKAEGVFLWVKLAVRDQIEGIRDKDDAEQLKGRLRALPTEIEGLYAHMLRKIHKLHRNEVAQYLQLALLNRVPSLLYVALAVYKCIDDVLLGSPDISTRDIRLHCEKIGERVDTACRGLLEVREDKNNEPDKESIRAAILKFLEMQKISLEQCEDLTAMFRNGTRIEFLHRTAFDFFKDNEQGKHFLETNTLMNPHPGVLHIKARTAYLVIFPTDHADHEYVGSLIGVIMKEAGAAEEETGVAQPALMDLIDRSLKILYKKSQDKPPNNHWCRGWDIPDRWGYGYEPRNDSGRFFDPEDFLGFAAYFGLGKYVEHILDSQPGGRKPGTEDYLLRCVVGGLIRNLNIEKELPRLTLISALSKRGADPNTKYSGGNAWSCFLTGLYEWYYTWYYENIHSGSDIFTWRSLVLAFLASGANVNERAYGVIDRRVGKVVNQLMRSEPTRMSRYKIRLRLSARSILQQCFADSPNFSEFEDAFTASGASLYSECTGISFSFHFPRYLEIWVDSKLSKQRLHEFMNGWREHLEAPIQDRKAFYQALDKQVAEIIQELDMEQLIEEARQERAILYPSILDEDSQDEEWITDTDSMSNEPTIDDPDSHTLEVEDPSYSARSSQAED